MIRIGHCQLESICGDLEADLANVVQFFSEILLDPL
jgi:hypothetical protein